MTTCSDGWDRAGLPALGTAPDAGFWVALEQPGPWGSKAFTQSRLDPDLGAALEGQVSQAGGRLLLVRDPVHHPDESGPRRVLVGGGPATSPWLAGCSLDDPSELPALLAGWPDLLSTPRPPAPLEPLEPVLLVCTNGRRDRCCAVKGAPLARWGATRHPGRVWEATHLGGHRFATTALVLPSRQVLAFVDEPMAEQALGGVLLAAGDTHDRGRSDLPQPARSADAWLRGRTGETDPAAFDYRCDGELVSATHRDGRSWQLRVQQATSPDVALPNSCGKPPVPARWWQVSEA